MPFFPLLESGEIFFDCSNTLVIPFPQYRALGGKNPQESFLEEGEKGQGWLGTDFFFGLRCIVLSLVAFLCQEVSGVDNCFQV